MKKAREHIDETLFLKIIENTANDAERQLFRTWIETSEMHADEFEQFKKTYRLTSFDTMNKQKNWESIVQKVNEGKAVPEYIALPGKKSSLIFLQTKAFMRMAAVFVLVIGISFLLKIMVFDSVQLTISGSNLKTHEPYLLADGSRVYLNGNSEINFSKKFGKNHRSLSLQGEAFFEVQPNKKLPFTITTGKTQTQVVGTSFNVFSDSTGMVKVSVVSGIVAFYSDKKEQGVKLNAGEQALYNPGLAKIEKESGNDPNFLSWKTGIIYFSETPINDAFKVLQKHYARVFVFEPGQESLPTITTTIDNQTLEAVLEELNLLLNTKNVIENDTIIFKSVH